MLALGFRKRVFPQSGKEFWFLDLKKKHAITTLLAAHSVLSTKVQEMGDKLELQNDKSKLEKKKEEQRVAAALLKFEEDRQERNERDAMKRGMPLS